MTINIIFNYTHKFAENETEFRSENTLRVLWNDINQVKRSTDRCYFEPYLHFDLNSDNTQTDKVWTDYEGNTLYTQKSIFMLTEFDSWDRIRFGNGKHSTIDLSITDVFIRTSIRIPDLLIKLPNLSGVMPLPGRTWW